jgi:hypothetical protein
MLPREGHLKAAKRILAYLKTFSKERDIFDKKDPNHSIYQFESHPNWKN